MNGSISIMYFWNLTNHFWKLGTFPWGASKFRLCWWRKSLWIYWSKSVLDSIVIQQSWLATGLWPLIKRKRKKKLCIHNLQAPIHRQHIPQLQSFCLQAIKAHGTRHPPTPISKLCKETKISLHAVYKWLGCVFCKMQGNKNKGSKVLSIKMSHVSHLSPYSLGRDPGAQWFVVIIFCLNILIIGLSWEHPNHAKTTIMPNCIYSFTCI